MVTNKAMLNAVKAKNDEFYTLLKDIEFEMGFYKEYFKDKVIYCNCDNPKYSEFWNYFYNNFKDLGLKKLIATWYQPDSFDNADMYEYDGKNIKVSKQFGVGDFRGSDCEFLLDDVDIVVTNPPFSLFTEFIDTLTRHSTDFIVLGSNMAWSYKCLKDRVLSNDVFVSYNGLSKSPDMYFKAPDNSLKKVACCWYSTLKPSKPKLKLDISKDFNNFEYKYYDNYDAIEVPDIKSIPLNYNGVFGVPATILCGNYDLSMFDFICYLNNLRINGKNKFNRALFRLKS